MTQDIKDYSVGELARHSGVSIRTLHHYDRIGLLTARRIGSNGYRLYSHDDALRLQEILFYRAAGMSLSEIAELLAAPHSALDRLTRHRLRLAETADQLARTIETLDATIAHLKGETVMAIDKLYAPFDAETQADYEAWLIETFGPDMMAEFARSRDAVESMPNEPEGAMDSLRTIETRLVEAYETGTDPDSADTHALLEEHRRWVALCWGRDCGPDGYTGLADLYMSHPDFVRRYETLSRQFSAWLPAAMKAHAARLRAQA